jgi:hypothetical protein
MGIKGLKISMIVNISFDTEAMPRLNPQQREHAIGRLHAGQPDLFWRAVVTCGLPQRGRSFVLFVAL